MKTFGLIFLGILVSILLLLGRVVYFHYHNNNVQKDKIIGRYAFDKEKSFIHSDIYNLDSIFFNFDRDMTFNIEMNEPYIRTGKGKWDVDVLCSGKFSDNYPLLIERVDSKSFYLYIYYSRDQRNSRDTFNFVKTHN